MCSSSPDPGSQSTAAVVPAKLQSATVELPPDDKAFLPRHRRPDKVALLPFTSQLTSHYKNPQNLVKIPYVKPYESTYVANRPLPGMERVYDQLKPKSRRKTKFYKEGLQAFYDIIVIGGGVMGCSAAFWLAQRVKDGVKILVVERDSTYSYSSTTMSVGGLRQQFSMPENIEMSLFGADFMRNANKILYSDKVYTPDVKFQPHGYLFLASEEGVDIMQKNHKTQIECGAKVELLTARQLKRKFPWLNTDGVALGSYGYENEGWFDPWALLTAFRVKCLELGVDFVEGEVYNITHDESYSPSTEESEYEAERLILRVGEVHVHLPDGDVFPFTGSKFVVAAGPESGHIANLMGIGLSQGLCTVPLPVEPRKRFVYNVHCPDGPGLDCPLVIDPSGTYFRREGLGGNYLCGRSPGPGDPEPDITNNDVDYDFFDEKVWPVIAQRCKAFEKLKIKSAWSGFYEYNTWDQNAIIGNHPYHSNVFFATGFSGHGIQQAPAIGRAIMELMYDDGYQTIDLSRLSFDRILNNDEQRERNIV